MFGIGPYHIRLLTDSEWSGGAGLPIDKVAELTLDQVFFLLADIEILRKSGRVRKLAGEHLLEPDEKGEVIGVDEEGNKFKAELYSEMSLAQKIRLQEKEAQEKGASDQSRPKKGWEIRSEQRKKRREARKKRERDGN